MDFHDTATLGNSAHSRCSVNTSSQPSGSSRMTHRAQPAISVRLSAAQCQNCPEKHAGWRAWRQQPSTSVSCGRLKAQTPTVSARLCGKYDPAALNANPMKTTEPTVSPSSGNAAS